MEGGLDIFQILLESGLVVKGVLVLLIVCSVISWAIIYQKRKFIRKIIDNDSQFVNFFEDSNNLIEINEQAEKYELSCTSTMFKYGFGELKKIRQKLKEAGKEKELRAYLTDHGMMALERSLKQGANEASELLDQRLSMLATIGSISPFIGLFGTVWGIIDSFAGLASGGGSIEAVAPGIAEALVATAVGLAAAIPAVWGYNYFSNKISILNLNMETFGQEFLNLIERSVLITKD